MRLILCSLGRRAYLGCAGCRHKGYTTLPFWRTVPRSLPPRRYHFNNAT